MRRAGLFLAILAKAVGELQDLGCALVHSDGGAQGCDPNEQSFMSPSGELQGLDLLQKAVRVQNKPAANAVAKSVVMKPQAFAKAENHKTQVQSLHSRLEPPLSLAKVMGGQSLHEGMHLHLLASGQSLLDSALMLGGMGVAIIVIILCGSFCFSRRGSQGGPSAQQLLQSPQCPDMAQSQSPSPANDDVGPMLLPPICTSLILPKNEARFMIPTESLMDAAGELDRRIAQLDIRGMSGRKLLHGSVSQTPQGQRCLTLASVGSDEVPLVTVVAPPKNDSHVPLLTGPVHSTMEIYGKDRKFYGTLEPVGQGGAELRYNGGHVMSLKFGGSDLSMSASSMDGQKLARAGKNMVESSVTRLESNDTWKLQVMPNLDAVLVTACMLGVLIFK